MITTLITGATSGIGYELAQQLMQRGDQLVLIGRRDPSELDTAFFTTDRYCQVDIAAVDATSIIGKFLQDHNITQLDYLIHNAGTGYFGDIATQSAESIIEVIDVNLIAPMRLTHALLPMIQAAHGKIVLISSVVASLPAPEYAVYAASKAALNEFGDNLRIELRGKAQVQVIHAGATQTEMHRKLGIPSERMDTSKFPSAESVAQKIIHAMNSNTTQKTIGIPNIIMRFAGKHLAGLIDFALKRSKA